MKRFPTYEENILKCSRFNKCSGCQVKKYLEADIYLEAKKYFHEIDSSLKFPLFSNGYKERRLRAKLCVSKNKKTTVLGLYKKNTHIVCDTSFCPVHHKSIQKACLIIKDKISRFDIDIYDEKKHKGLLRYMQFIVERKTKKVNLTLVLNTKRKTDKINAFASFLYYKTDLFSSIYYNYQSEKTNVIFGKNWELAFGRKFISQKIGSVNFALLPSNFMQANLSLFEKLIFEISKDVEKNKNAIEFYAGSGCIGLNLLSKLKYIDFVEVNPSSKISFNETAKKLDFQNFEFHQKEVKDAISLLDGKDLVIVDPPRKGLDGVLLEALCLKKDVKLLYISCNFFSFKKDADKLLNSGYLLKKARAYLFFPGTNQIELYGVFEKKSG